MTVTDSQGCTYSTSANVSGPAELEVSSSHEDVSCYGAGDGTVTASIDGGTAPYTFTWSNGVEVSDVTISTTIDGLINGGYGVIITDANGCQAVAFEVVDQPAPLTLAASVEDEVCVNDGNGSIDLTPSGGNGGNNFNWSNGADTEDISGLTAGTYDVTVTDSEGCTATGSWTINSEDNIKPVVTCPGDLTVDCIDEVPVSDVNDVTATDNCMVAGVVLFSENDNGGAGCVSDPLIITRVYMAFDMAGNNKMCTQTITVEDDVAPTFTAPADATIATDADCAYDADPSITGDVEDVADNCSENLEATYSDVTVDRSM